MLCVLEVLVALLILAFVGFKLIEAHHGDANVQMDVKGKTEAVKVAEYDDRVDFEVRVPYTNLGKEEGVILDAYMRIFLPQEQYSDVLLRGKVNHERFLRDDDYFEAMLTPAGKKEYLILRMEAYAKNGKTIAEALGNIPDVDVAIFLECRGRCDLITKKAFITLTQEEMHALVK